MLLTIHWKSCHIKILTIVRVCGVAKFLPITVQ